MNLQLTADQTFTRDEAQRLLADRADSAALRRAIDAGGFDAALWQLVGAELGWCAVAIPEDDGGLGLGLMELVLLAEQCGRRLAPVPFWSTACLVAPVVAALGAGAARSDLLGRIAAGEAAAMALPLNSAVRIDPGELPSAMSIDGGWTLGGSVPVVLDLPSAGILVVPARTPDGIGLFGLDIAGHDMTRCDGIDLTRPAARLDLERLPARRIDEGAMTLEALEAALLPGRLAAAAEMVGAAQGALDLTLGYIAERVQFGRTIASFQAVKHRCAELVVDISEARSLVYGAASTDEIDRLDVLGAGALAAQVLFRAAEEAIQLHGGVGNTWEYDPHLYLRRAQASAGLFGSADDKLAAIADTLLGADA